MSQQNSKPVYYEWGNRRIKEIEPLPAKQISQYQTTMYGQPVTVRRFKGSTYSGPTLTPAYPADRPKHYSHFGLSLEYREFKKTDSTDEGKLPRISPPWTKEQVSTLIEEFESGKTLKQIGITLGMTSDRVSNKLGHLRRKGEL